MFDIAISKYELFEILKKNYFIIGNKTVNEVFNLIETKIEETLKKDSKIFHEIECIMIKIKNKWRKLKGGKCRTAFQNEMKNANEILSLSM